MRAYSEINDFEQQLADRNVVLVKFCLVIDKGEQYKRFKARGHVRLKHFQITAEDRRNRKKWNDYERAVAAMVDLTCTAPAPWTLVEANHKYYARIKVLRTLAFAIEAGSRRISA